MSEAKHDLSRMSFQMERFITFSDGVFAIVITLMVFDIKVPELTSFNDRELWQKLTGLGSVFLGFVISFGVVGYYWWVHHRIFGYALKYSTKLLWINFGYLFTVAILPFSSKLYGEYSSYTNMQLPYAVYVLNICLTAFMNYWLWIYISNPKRDMLTRKISKARITLGVYRCLVIPIIFLASFLISLFHPISSRFVLLLIPIVLLWGMSGFEKRADLADFKNIKKEDEKTNADALDQHKT
ncbi:MAG: TMEM175 family protein [Ginsengibacter sp.]